MPHDACSLKLEDFAKEGLKNGVEKYWDSEDDTFKKAMDKVQDEVYSNFLWWKVNTEMKFSFNC